MRNKSQKVFTMPPVQWAISSQ